MDETTGGRIFRFFLSLVLMTCGVLFTLYGMTAVRDGSVHWDLGRDRHGDLMQPHSYAGAEARWFGISWIAFGAYWALSASSLMGVRRRTGLTRATSIAALVSLAFAVLSWYPPWRFACSRMTAGVWGTVSGVGIVLAPLRPKTRPTGCLLLVVLWMAAVLVLGVMQSIDAVCGAMVGMIFVAAAVPHAYLLLHKSAAPALTPSDGS